MVSFLGLCGIAVGTAAICAWRQASLGVNLLAFVLQLFAATLLPLLAYMLYLRLGYAVWSWSPASYGSMLPAIVAALGSFVAVAFLLWPQPVRVGTKLVVFSASLAVWALLCSVGSLHIACAAGDCL